MDLWNKHLNLLYPPACIFMFSQYNFKSLIIVTGWVSYSCGFEIIWDCLSNYLRWFIQSDLYCLWPASYSYQDFSAREAISVDVQLRAGCETDEYISKLSTALDQVDTEFKPQLIVYNAGTDILAGIVLSFILSFHCILRCMCLC